MAYLIAAALFWVGLIVSGLIYNQRRRSQQRCESIACSRQSRDLERVTIPSRVDGLTFAVRLCPDCFAGYSRWVREREDGPG